MEKRMNVKSNCPVAINMYKLNLTITIVYINETKFHGYIIISNVNASFFFFTIAFIHYSVNSVENKIHFAKQFEQSSCCYHNYIEV